MFFRIIGLLLCLIPMIWGTLSIHAGIESATFGPAIGGVFIFLGGLAVFWVIVYETALQLVGVVTAEPETLLESVYEPFQNDFTTHRELNTPNPHLIHPDDTKHAARLNIKV